MKRTQIQLLSRIAIFFLVLSSVSCSDYHRIENEIINLSSKEGLTNIDEIMPSNWTDLYAFDPSFKTDEIRSITGSEFDEYLDIERTILILNGSEIILKEIQSGDPDKNPKVYFSAGSEGYFHLERGNGVRIDEISDIVVVTAIGD